MDAHLIRGAQGELARVGQTVTVICPSDDAFGTDAPNQNPRGLGTFAYDLRSRDKSQELGATPIRMTSETLTQRDSLEINVTPSVETKRPLPTENLF